MSKTHTQAERSNGWRGSWGNRRGDQKGELWLVVVVVVVVVVGWIDHRDELMEGGKS